MTYILVHEASHAHVRTGMNVLRSLGVLLTLVLRVTCMYVHTCLYVCTGIVYVLLHVLHDVSVCTHIQYYIHNICMYHVYVQCT